MTCAHAPDSAPALLKIVVDDLAGLRGTEPLFKGFALDRQENLLHSLTSPRSQRGRRAIRIRDNVCC